MFTRPEEEQTLMQEAKQSSSPFVTPTTTSFDPLVHCLKCSGDRPRRQRLRLLSRSRRRRQSPPTPLHCEYCGSSLDNEIVVPNASKTPPTHSNDSNFISPPPSRMRRCCCVKSRTQNQQTEVDRLIQVGLSNKSKNGKSRQNRRYASNAIQNRKYNAFTFLPLVLFQQFRMFLNFYFLAMALSQFIPGIRVGYLYTYWGPLVFVLLVTLIREAYDDVKRARRDRNVNMEMYKCWRRDVHEEKWVVGDVPAASIQVGDIIVIEPDQRVPADLVLLYSQVSPGTCFIRTDQLDGETDWKLRMACGFSQRVVSACTTENKENPIEQQPVLSDLPECLRNATVRAQAPNQSIVANKSLDQFEGIFICGDDVEEPLSVENMLWSGTVLATRHPVLACTIYTGRDTRMAMNTTKTRAKIGLLDLEINRLTKLLFAFVLILAMVMIILKGFHGPWYRYLFRFVLLFSYIIPISLRVNMDLGKMVYGYFMSTDLKHCPGTVVRSSTIPEELGRISYLLSDKTGTLTRNEMVFKRVHLGTIAFGTDNLQELRLMLSQSSEAGSAAAAKFSADTDGYLVGRQTSISTGASVSKYSSFAAVRRTTAGRVREVVQAIAVCHNVMLDTSDDTEGQRQYQASSPDEVCLVQFCESIGLRLWKRDAHSIVLKQDDGGFWHFTVLHIFPFTSELKRMGLIVRDEQTQEIIFYIKGADSAIAPMVLSSKNSDWLTEETSNMAREGLRILVYGYRVLTPEQYALFDHQYTQAQLSVGDRTQRCREAIEYHLESELELLCVTGVEDSLQANVRPTLEALRNAGIRVWMLTGDKMETAACIARSSRLFTSGRDQTVHWFTQTPLTPQQLDEEIDEITNLASTSTRCSAYALIITGSSLRAALEHNEKQFIEAACRASAVVVCRCSPTQKADVVDALKRQTKCRVAAVGDGGNDVSMIQKAHAGIGIVGKEGHQASLAADFSISQFSHIKPLLLVHGRNCYKRSAALAQFVMHRGLVISIAMLMGTIRSQVFTLLQILSPFKPSIALELA
ncbi:hypothetical protein ACOME3_000417 [Neoechinorhynchus agilis]